MEHAGDDEASEAGHHFPTPVCRAPGNRMLCRSNPVAALSRLREVNELPARPVSLLDCFVAALAAMTANAAPCPTPLYERWRRRQRADAAAQAGERAQPFENPAARRGGKDAIEREDDKGRRHEDRGPLGHPQRRMRRGLCSAPPASFTRRSGLSTGRTRKTREFAPSEAAC